VNTAGDTGKLILTQSPNSLLNLFNAHVTSWYRLWVAGSCVARAFLACGVPTPGDAWFPATENVSA
jgi:hypothetical protein